MPGVASHSVGDMDFAANSFAGIALDGSDFDAPVYRSLSDFSSEDAPVYRSLSDAVFSSGEHSPSWALEEDLETTPVYRSMGSAFDDASPMNAEAAERQWLETMPPLIKRQHARGASSLTL